MKYAEKLKLQQQAYINATQQTIQQLMADTAAITLNDPAVMGKDVLGKGRLKRFNAAWTKNVEYYMGALLKGDLQDYIQNELDERLKKIFGDDFTPSAERYPFVTKPKYRK